MEFVGASHFVVQPRGSRPRCSLARVQWGGWLHQPTSSRTRFYREIVILVAEHLSHRIITLRDSDRRLVVRNLGGGVSEIRAKSADNPTSLLGEGLDWLIVDEAARLKPVIWQSHLSQRLIDKQGRYDQKLWMRI